MARLVLGLSVLVIFALHGIFADEDLPCQARDVGIPGRSVVCVCNATYCDTISRIAPEPQQYVVYTSSHSGKRFEKSFGTLQTIIDPEPEPTTTPEPEETSTPQPEASSTAQPESSSTAQPESSSTAQPESSSTAQPEAFSTPELEDEEEVEGMSAEYIEEEDIDDGNTGFNSLFSNVRLRVFPNTRYHTIEGFGGAVTDAAAINWRLLSDGAQTNLIKTYYGKEGLEYNMIRTPIGGCDFSDHVYTLNDYPWHDNTLSNFSLTHEDYFFKMPMIKRAMNFATDEVKIIASTWSPPLWMKTNQKITGFSRLLPEYHQLYADYHIRFMEEYEKAEIKIWSITTTNEPINGVVPFVNFNSLGWTPAGLGRWVADNLGPTIRKSRFNATKILGVDDQRYIVPIWMSGMQKEAPESIDYLDGMAIHYYGNFIPPQILTAMARKYPGKMIVSTEACEGPMPWDSEKVSIGSWERAGKYVKSIMQDLNNFVCAWVDWNLCLSPTGGPNWAANYVDSPILVFAENDEFVKQPMYYGVGHFSKFIPRGSIRIRVSRRSLASVENIAFLKPDGNIVMVFQNRKSRDLNVRVKISRKKFFEFTIESKSIMTFEINPQES